MASSSPTPKGPSCSANQAFLDLAQIGAEGVGGWRATAALARAAGGRSAGAAGQGPPARRGPAVHDHDSGRARHGDRGGDFGRDATTRPSRNSWPCCCTTRPSGCPLRCVAMDSISCSDRQPARPRCGAWCGPVWHAIERHYHRRGSRSDARQPYRRRGAARAQPSEPLRQAQPLRFGRERERGRRNRTTDPAELGHAVSHRHDSARFGQADLSNCEREQIHFAGSVQPHGALLVVREPDHVVCRRAPMRQSFLDLPRCRAGLSARRARRRPAERSSRTCSRPSSEIPIAVRCRVGRRASLFDGLLHRPPDGGLVIELERAGPPVDLRGEVENALQTILAASSLRTLARRDGPHLQGPDRLRPGHGLSLRRRRPWRGVRRAPRAQLEPFLGNRYPASDIPQIARRLYERNRVRVLVDVGPRQVAADARTVAAHRPAISTCRCASCAACRQFTSST